VTKVRSLRGWRTRPGGLAPQPPLRRPRDTASLRRRLWLQEEAARLRSVRHLRL